MTISVQLTPEQVTALQELKDAGDKGLPVQIESQNARVALRGLGLTDLIDSDSNLPEGADRPVYPVQRWYITERGKELLAANA